MLSIPHSLTGAFLASQIPHPAFYIPAAVSAHYLEDWIPHWDFGTGLSTGKRSVKTALFFEVLELVATFGLLYWFFQAGHAQIQWHIWLGALAGILPDLLDAPKNFLKLDLPFLRPLTDLHHFFHHSTHHVFFGLIPQILVVIAVYLLK
ncbi:hypothetical protein KJZ63_02815 [Patescibacteria group bacterium]|nr:hypothetical protein [Patescibacteria group bacterium]